jgi:hypothetical protein
LIATAKAELLEQRQSLPYSDPILADTTKASRASAAGAATTAAAHTPSTLSSVLIAVYSSISCAVHADKAYLKDHLLTK